MRPPPRSIFCRAPVLSKKAGLPLIKYKVKFSREKIFVINFKLLKLNFIIIIFLIKFIALS